MIVCEIRVNDKGIDECGIDDINKRCEMTKLRGNFVAMRNDFAVAFLYCTAACTINEVFVE